MEQFGSANTSDKKLELISVIQTVGNPQACQKGQMFTLKGCLLALSHVTRWAVMKKKQN